MAIVAELLARLGVDTRAFEKDLKKAERALKRTGDNLIATGRSLTVGITAPLAAIGTIAIKSFADFDQALTQSTAIIDGTTQQLAQLETTARDVAKSTVFSAKETAEAFFFLASAGLDVEQSIAALPQVAAFATAGVFDLATATDLLTDAQSALGLTVDDAQENLVNLTQVSDVLVKANTIANASVRQFSEALTNQAAVAGRNARLSIEEIVSVLAVFADQGIKGADAGTKFAIVLRDLTTKAAINKDAFAKLGVAVFDVNRNLLPIADIVANLERALGGASVETQKLTLLQLGFSDRSVGVLQTLIGTSKQLRIYKKDLSDVGGITAIVSDKQLKSFQNQLILVGSKVADVAISLGDVLAPIIVDVVIPVIEKAVERFENLLSVFESLGDTMQSSIILLTAVAGAIGPVLLAVGLLTKAMGGLGTVTGRLVPIFAITGVLIVGIAAFAAKLAEAKDNIGDTITEVKKLGEEIEKLKAKDAALAFQKLNREFQNASREAEETKVFIDALNESTRFAKSAAGIAQLERLTETFDEAKIKAQQLKEEIDRIFPIKQPEVDTPDLGGDDFKGPQLPLLQQPFFADIIAGFENIKLKSSEAFEAIRGDLEAFGENVKAPFVGLTEFFISWFAEQTTLWDEYVAFVTDANMRVAEIGVAAFDAMAEGLASAIVVAVQGVKSFSDALIDIFSNLFANIVQQLLAFIIKFIAVKISQIVFETTAAEAKKGIGGLVAALIALPILIGATIALSNAQSKKAGKAVKLQGGGLVGASGLAFLHEGEGVLTEDEVKTLDTGSGRGLDLTIMLDGRVLARKVMEQAPRQLRLRSV